MIPRPLYAQRSLMLLGWVVVVVAVAVVDVISLTSPTQRSRGLKPPEWSEAFLILSRHSLSRSTRFLVPYDIQRSLEELLFLFFKIPALASFTRGFTRISAPHASMRRKSSTMRNIDDGFYVYLTWEILQSRLRLCPTNVVENPFFVNL